MRVGLFHPTYWPEVRRGSERVLNGLARSLIELGHEVHLFTFHSHPTRVTIEGGVVVKRARRIPDPPLKRLATYEHHILDAPRAAVELIRSRVDIAHCFFPTEAFAAATTQSFHRTPIVFSMHGYPSRRYLVARRHRIAMLERIVATAGASTVLSEAAASAFTRYLGVAPEVVPPGVDLDDFPLSSARSERPSIFFPGSTGDPRKRISLALEAFAQVKEAEPAATLTVARTPDPFHSPDQGDIDLPDGAEWVDVKSAADMAACYGSAWVTCLPSVEEAFGLVVVESLACGTPFVGVRSGAIPELISDPTMGAAVDPESSEELAQALLTRLQAPPSGKTASQCRSFASSYDWPSCAARFTAIYESLT